jgi:uncharacterized membrane protein YqjE
VTAGTTPYAGAGGDGPRAAATRRAAARLRLVARWIDRPTGPLATHLGLHLRVLAIDTRQELARITRLVALAACALLLVAALDALMVTIVVLSFEQNAARLAVLGAALLLHGVALAAVVLHMRRQHAAAAAAYAATRAEFTADLDLLRSLR